MVVNKIFWNLAVLVCLFRSATADCIARNPNSFSPPLDPDLGCEAQGGICTFSCDPNTHTCITDSDLCDIVVGGSNRNLQGGCQCAIPKPDPACSCTDDCDSDVYSDPHFEMWSGRRYDFQWECDLVHVTNSLLDLHIRTEFRGVWSAVVNAALRFDTDIFEIEGNGAIRINGVLLTGAAPPALDGLYTIIVGTFTGTGRRTVTIVMAGGQYIEFKTTGNHINIYIDANGADFCDSQGTAGNWQLDGFISRDGVTPVFPISLGNNKVEYGVEWEVSSGLGDPDLFFTSTNSSCAVEPACQGFPPGPARHLGKELCNPNARDPTEEQLDAAQDFCKNLVVDLDDLDNCKFDVVLMGEQWVKENTPYQTKNEPTKRCVPVAIDEVPIEFPPDDEERERVPPPPPGLLTCADLGGECVFRCDPDVFDCIEGSNLCRQNLVAIGDRRNLQGGPTVDEFQPDLQPDLEPDPGFIPGCSCAVPKPTLPPTTAAPTTAAPTSCPPSNSYPAIAGYLPRSNATQCLAWDSIQKELEDIMADESCPSLDNGEDFYNNGLGQYFKTIPEYAVKSTVYEEYTKYYNNDDFLQIWIEKAFQQSKTNFARGNANFGNVFPNDTAGAGTCVGFEEIVKKSTAYTGQLVNSYQYVQKAIDSVGLGCYAQDNGCTNAIEAIDCAVSAYVGSLEGTEGNNNAAGDYGKGPYALADRRCRNYHKCGPTKDSFLKDETSPVNAQIMSLFAAASHAAWLGDADLLEIYLRLISNKSVIPLIQGSFRYYYRLSDEENGLNTFSTFDKYLGEGGAFIFGALPKLWACSKKGESKAYNQSKLGYGGPAGNAAVNFQTIKLAFECNYRCLGIRCEEVGALYDDDTATSPKIGAGACDDAANGSEDVCAKPKKSRKQACKKFIGKPGIRGRDKLKFTF